MNEEEMLKMPIEEIIHLPNFFSLESYDPIEMEDYLTEIVQPHWKVTFRAEPTKRGTFIANGREIPHRRYCFFILKTHTL
jgi:hypothetical protein